MYRIRYQTGESDEIIQEMKKGNIPCMDVDDNKDLEMFLNILNTKGIYRDIEIPYDKNARDRIKEPEFEFRIAFKDDLSNKMFIDFYFEPLEERTYGAVYGD